MAVQEEIEQKSFNIMISTTKLSARTVLRAVKAAFRLYQSKASQGKQSVRTLLRQNRGVSSVEGIIGTSELKTSSINVFFIIVIVIIRFSPRQLNGLDASLLVNT